MVRLLLTSVFALSASAYVGALETVPRGQLKIQANYNEPALANDARWRMQMPETWLGLTAAETINTSVFVGHVQFGFDPLADDPSVSFVAEQAYVSWNQNAFSLWGGRLPTLEQVYLEDLYSGLLSLPDSGLGAADRYNDSENNAVRLDYRSGDYLVFSTQWQIDETNDDLLWHSAGAVQTNEGSVSLTYRKDGDADAIWGNQITWLTGNTAVSGAWVAQDGIQEWDAEVRFNSATVQYFVGYGQDANNDQRWAAGIHQGLSEAMTSYSEVIWWPEIETWQWNTGFQLAF